MADTASLSGKIYTTAQIRELERIAIEELGITGFELMFRAGSAAFNYLRQLWPEARELIVVCGPGNNGGDGYIVAGLARENGMEVRVFTCGEPDNRKPDACQAKEFALSREIAIRPLDGAVVAFEAKPDTVLVDALLGTGLKGEIREPYARAIHLMNSSELPILALDVPSGLDSDTGGNGKTCIRADATITFIGMKTGLGLAGATTITGKAVVDDLGLPAEIYK